MEQGVKIKRYIENENSNHVLVVKEIVTFSSNDIDTKYRSYFDDLIDEGILLNCEFNDSIWHGVDEFENNIFLRFSFELQPDINTALKCYALIKICEQYSSLGNTYKAINFISDILTDTNFLNIEYLETFKESVKFWIPSFKSNSVYAKEFLRFYLIENAEEYYSVLSTIKIQKSGSRTLPSYKSIITFDFLIQDFINNCNNDIKLKFLPIIIWWELTKVIPMRPIELGILKRDCLGINTEGNKIIKIERRKKKSGKILYKQLKILTELAIPNHVYDLINEYLLFSNSISDSIFLFSNEAYKTTVKRSYRVSEIDFIGMTAFRELLNTFFIEVVESIYGYTTIPKSEFENELSDNEIEKINLGDTRHIAFCNMMLQGFNPLTIAQIGGHYTLTEQTSYYGHLDNFIDSYTFVLTKNLRNKINQRVNNTTSINDICTKDKLIKRTFLGDNFYTLRKLKGGRCCSENFPYECNFSGHIYCEHFIPDETLTLEIIKEQLNPVENEINNKVNYLKKLSSDLISYKGGHKLEEEIKTVTNKLNTLLKQKSILTAYKLNMEEYNE